MKSVAKDSIEINKKKLQIIHLEVKILRKKKPRSFFYFFYFFVLFLFCFIGQHSKPYNRSL